MVGGKDASVDDGVGFLISGSVITLWRQERTATWLCPYLSPPFSIRLVFPFSLVSPFLLSCSSLSRMTGVEVIPPPPHPHPAVALYVPSFLTAA